MKAGRIQGAMPLPFVIGGILAGVLVLSIFFYAFWQKLNQRVENILREQFNQQQLELARKIGDNVEAYIDILETAILDYAGLFATMPLYSPTLGKALAERFERHKNFGVLELRRYDMEGQQVQSLSAVANPLPPGPLTLLPKDLAWAKDPDNQGRLFLSKTYYSAEPSWQGRRVMRLFTPLYSQDPGAKFIGVLELLIDPFFIARRVTEGVRSGETGYPWIIDQDGILLAHYEKDFVGQDAIKVRMARNPKIVFKGLRELQDHLLKGEEGTTEYTSGWHRAKLGETPKLAAYSPICFDKGLIRGITEKEDPAHNLWGVTLAAPVAEVSGNVAAVMHQELFLVGTFFLVVFLAGGSLIGLALSWNRMLTRQVEIKTKELLESQERLLRSERFAAVGEAAAYVSHEIKNPLMVIGGLAQQVERRLSENPACQEKLQIIQGEVRRLENFLGDLRDFTRPALPVKQTLDLNQVIREVMALMESECRDKQVTLVSQLAAQLPTLEADPNQMKQILVNLFKNALEAMDGPGQITVASGAEDGQVWFSVRDTGVGMPPEVVEKIFNPFFTTKDKGTGLGLAVIHKIITDHQGSITVESTPGRGTHFTVRLPQGG